MFKLVGGFLILIGAIWIGQGLGYVGGSFMTGQSQWTWIGAATAIAGLALMFVRRR